MYYDDDGKKYKISEKGKQYIEEKLKVDPKFNEEYQKFKGKLLLIFPRLLNMSKKELFDEVFNNLGKKKEKDYIILTPLGKSDAMILELTPNVQKAVDNLVTDFKKGKESDLVLLKEDAIRVSNELGFTSDESINIDKDNKERFKNKNIVDVDYLNGDDK